MALRLPVVVGGVELRVIADGTPHQAFHAGDLQLGEAPEQLSHDRRLRLLVVGSVGGQGEVHDHRGLVELGTDEAGRGDQGLGGLGIGGRVAHGGLEELDAEQVALGDGLSEASPARPAPVAEAQHHLDPGPGMEDPDLLDQGIVEGGIALDAVLVELRLQDHDGLPPAHRLLDPVGELPGHPGPARAVLPDVVVAVLDAALDRLRRDVVAPVPPVDDRDDAALPRFPEALVRVVPAVLLVPGARPETAVGHGQALALRLAHRGHVHSEAHRGQAEHGAGVAGGGGRHGRDLDGVARAPAQPDCARVGRLASLARFRRRGEAAGEGGGQDEVGGAPAAAEGAATPVGSGEPPVGARPPAVGEGERVVRHDFIVATVWPGVPAPRGEGKI